MDSQFRIKIVLYLLLRTFNWLVNEETMDQQLELSLAIKEEYRKLLLEEVFRGDNHFELFVLFHIKVTVLFILDEFERVQADNGLEC